MNTEIVQLQTDVVAVLNKSGMPLEVKRLVLKEVLEKVTVARDEAIRMEQQALKEKEVKQNDESA